jgi:hypothetical protein
MNLDLDISITEIFADYNKFINNEPVKNLSERFLVSGFPSNEDVTKYNRLASMSEHHLDTLVQRTSFSFRNRLITNNKTDETDETDNTTMNKKKIDPNSPFKKDGSLKTKAWDIVTKYRDSKLTQGLLANEIVHGGRQIYNISCDPGTFSRLYNDMLESLAELVSNRYTPETFERVVPWLDTKGNVRTKSDGTPRTIRKYLDFRNSPCINFSVDAKGTDRCLEFSTQQYGKIQIHVPSSKWIINDQNFVVHDYHKLPEPKISIKEHILQMKPSIEIRSKYKNTSYMAVGNLHSDGSCKLFVTIRSLLSFLFILERNGEQGLKKMGKLCETCLFCGKQLTDAESIARGAGSDCANKFYAPNLKRNDNLSASKRTDDNSFLRNITYIRSLLPNNMSTTIGNMSTNIQERILSCKINVQSIERIECHLPVWLCGDVISSFMTLVEVENENDIDELTKKLYPINISTITMEFLYDFSTYFELDHRYNLWLQDFILTFATKHEMDYTEFILYLYGEFDFLQQDKLQSAIVNLLQNNLQLMSFRDNLKKFNTYNYMMDKITIDYVTEWKELKRKHAEIEKTNKKRRKQKISD